MALREKTKRRATWVVAGVLTVAILGSGGIYARRQQLRMRDEAKYAQGLELLKAGDYFDALHSIGPFFRWHPDDPAALYAYAQARLQVEMPENKHYLETVGLLRRVVDLDPTNLQAHRELLNLYSAIGFHSEALLTSEALLKRSPNDPVALRARATAFLVKKSYPEALAVTTQWIALAPDDVDARILHIHAIARSQSPEAAKGLAEKEVAAHPTSISAWVQSVEAGLLAGDEKMAGAAIGKAVELVEASSAVPPAPVLRRVIAYCDRAQAPQAFAISMRLALRGADAGLPGFESDALRRLYFSGKPGEAADRAAKGAAAAVPPGVDFESQASAREVPTVRALLLALAGRKEEARAIAAKLGPDQKDWVSVLDELLAPETDDQRLITKLEAALRQRPRSPMHLSLLGDAYDRVGERESALRYWAMAAEYPRPQRDQPQTAAGSWSEPLIRYSRTCLAMGRIEAGMEAARAAQNRSPESPEPARLLLQIYVDAARAGIGVSSTLSEDAAKLSARFPKDAIFPALHARLLASRQDAAGVKRLAEAVLAREGEATVEALMYVSEACRELKLSELAERAMAAAEQRGPSPELASLRARVLASEGNVAGGLKVLADGKAAAAGKKGEREWALAEAAYLERTNDPRAKDNWLALAEARPTDARVQWQVVGAPSVHKDRAAVLRSLDRLKGLTGQFGLSYRMTKARFLLETAAKDSPEVGEAAMMLGEVTRSAPEVAFAHVLLAEALERMGNIPGAVEQYALLNETALTPELHLQYARLLQLSGDAEKSKAELKKAVASRRLSTEQSRVAAALAAQHRDPASALELLGADENPALDQTKAALHWQLSQFDKVDALLPKLMAKGDVKSLEFVASYQGSRGRMAEAQEAIARLKGHTGNDAGAASIVRGDWHSRFRQHDKAIEAYEDAVKAAPSEPLGWRRLLAAQISMQDWKAVASTASRAAAAAPKDEALKVIATQVPRLEKRMVGDIVYSGLIAGLLQSSPAEVNPIKDALSVVTDGSKDTQSVLTSLRSVADQNPRSLPLQLAAAKALYLAGRFDDSAAIAQRAMEGFPGDALSAQYAASALSAAGRTAEARVAGERWRQRSSDDTVTPDVLISLLDLKLGKPKEAMSRIEPYMEQALREPDGNMALLLQFGRTKIASNRADEFMTQLRPLLPTSSTARQVIMRLAAEEAVGNRGLIWLGELAPHIAPRSMSETITYAESLARLNQRSPDPEVRKLLESTMGRLANESAQWDDPALGGLLSLASLQEAMEANAAAAATYRRILKLDPPDNAIALNNLAYLLSRTGGSAEEALALSNKAVAKAKSEPEEDPRRVDYLDTQSRILASLKRYDEAIASIEEANSLRPQNPEILLQLASLQMQKGDGAKAKSVFRQAMDLNPSEGALSKEAKAALVMLKDQYKN